MQTFLPYPDFAQSIAALDNKRLGKQRVEARQIMNALTRFIYDGEVAGWLWSSATAMWINNIDALALYYNLAIDEWERRGYSNTLIRVALTESPIMPSWLGDPELHASHRSNLLRKDPTFYSQYGWTEPPYLDYVWPIS